MLWRVVAAAGMAAMLGGCDGGSGTPAEAVARSRSALADRPRPCAVTDPAAASQAERRCRATPGAEAGACHAARRSCPAIAAETARACAAQDRAAPAACRPDPRSAEAAVAVVRLYYAAIDAGDFATAWAQWGPGGQPGRDYAAFVAGFATTRSATVAVTGAVESDAGAGSIYATVPVAIKAIETDGRRRLYSGSYVLRRVNDVDGASAAQRRWHIASARLVPQK
ncbi:MAG: hypothetical protein PGN09_03785 [Sphingomonas fennica]